MALHAVETLRCEDVTAAEVNDVNWLKHNCRGDPIISNADTTTQTKAPLTPGAGSSPSRVSRACRPRSWASCPSYTS